MHSKYSTYSVGLRLHTPQLWNYRSGLCGVLCDKFFIMGKAVKISYYDWSLSWLTPLMFKGAKRPLKKKDLYALTGLTATSKTLPDAPLSLWRGNSGIITFSFLLNAAAISSALLQPIYMARLILYFQNSEQLSSASGIQLVAILFGLMVVS